MDITTETTTTLDCPDCNGGTRERFFRPEEPCLTCKGAAKVTVDREPILAAIFTSRGGTRRLRSAVSPAMRDVYGAEYVWRMARFHGGADVTMPVTCFYSVGCHGIIDAGARAVLDVLDPIADEVAKEAFGTNLGAAARWAPLLGVGPVR